MTFSLRFVFLALVFISPSIVYSEASSVSEKSAIVEKVRSRIDTMENPPEFAEKDLENLKEFCSRSEISVDDCRARAGRTTARVTRVEQFGGRKGETLQELQKRREVWKSERQEALSK